MSTKNNMATLGNFAEIIPLDTDTVPPYTTTNTVAYGRREFVLIDPATKRGDQQDFLKSYVEQRIDRGDQLVGIYLSHHHGDHVGAAAFIAKIFGTPIYAHQRASKHLDFSLSKHVDDGDLIKLGALSLKILYTPGHAESHIVFYDPDQKILIAGDMITDRGTVLIPPGTGSLKVYLESLTKLSRLELTAVVPGHGLVIKKDANQFLIRAIKHRLGRLLSIYETLEKNQDRVLDGTDITNLVYQNNIAESLMFFAQLSVESSLYWLKESGLAKNPDYKWQLAPNHQEIKFTKLTVPLEEINDRLRDT